MGFLTDLWNQICEFFEIEAVEPITPKEPPKPYEPVESVTTLPKKPVATAPIEPIEPLPSEPIHEATPIGEQGRADRIEVLPAKPEPERPLEPTPAVLPSGARERAVSAEVRVLPCPVEGYCTAEAVGYGVQDTKYVDPVTGQTFHERRIVKMD